MKKPDDSYKNAMKTAKRITLTILSCVPFVIILAYLLRNYLTKNWQQVLVFTLIFGLAVLFEEIIYSQKMKKKQREEILNAKRDVFK